MTVINLSVGSCVMFPAQARGLSHGVGLALVVPWVPLLKSRSRPLIEQDVAGDRKLSNMKINVEHRTFAAGASAMCS